jgi:hypothetical protein
MNPQEEWGACSKYGFLVCSSSGAGRGFVRDFSPYIIHEWTYFYFDYDSMKIQLNAVASGASLESMNRTLKREIGRVHRFVEFVLNDIKNGLHDIQQCVDGLDSALLDIYKREGTVERIFLTSYEMLRNLRSYYFLNCYLIAKIGVRYEMLEISDFRESTISVGSASSSGSSQSRRTALSTDSEFPKWSQTSSYKAFSDLQKICHPQIKTVSRFCVSSYGSLFRKDFPSLSHGELEYQKEVDGLSTEGRVYVGFKIGLVIAMVSPPALLAITFYL